MKRKIVNKKNLFYFFVLVFLVVGSINVKGEIVSPVSLDVGTSSSRDLSSLPTQTAQAQGGNITQLNINVLTITKAWQGYYGNITGTITLDDANNKTFYNWSVTTVDGEVYATRTSSVDFTTLDCANSTEISNEESYLGQVAGDGDSVTNTFTFTGGYGAFLAGSASIPDTCKATRLYSNEAQSATDFWEVLLADGSSNIVYTALIDNDKVGYDGGTYDFQMLVGENEHSGNTGPTPYYFYVELS